MEDLERYGDYTEYEDDIPKGKKNPVVLVLKIMVFVVCFAVIGVFAFRLVLFNYYPDSMSEPYFTETLKEYCKSNGGEISAKTQELRSPYDDPDVANFFCDNLIVVDSIGELQISVRYNNAALENIKTVLNLDTIDPSDTELFRFRLYDNYDRTYEPPVAVVTDELMMYHYYKLVFDEIPFDTEGVDSPEWIRLEVFVKGQTAEEPFSKILIYENHTGYSNFDEVDISLKGESK